MLYYIAVFLFKLPLMLLTRPKIYGKKENLKLKDGAIFVCNHRAMIDPVMLAAISPRAIHFMAKKELFETKLGKWFFSSLLVFPVSRKSADIKSIKKAIALLNEGKVFGIFPEGRRSVTEDMDDFERGTAFIAAKSNAPIVPIYISPDSYRKSFRFKAMIGDVIYPAEIAKRCDKRKAVDVINNEMQNSLANLGFMMKQITDKTKHGGVK